MLAADVRINSPKWVRSRTTCRLNLAEDTKLPLSAAIGASARFPFVSDWGWLRRRPASPGCEELEGVADGGFYDNYGAATILDLLDGLKKYAGIDLQTAVKLVVIQITSNPTREMGCLFKTLDTDGYKTESDGSAEDDCSPAAEKPKFREPSVTDVAMQARGVTGIEVAEQLRKLTCTLGGSYYHFAMTGAKDVPLGWTLSITSQNRLSDLLCRQHRDKSRPAKARLDRLVDELKTGDKRGQCAKSP